MRISGVKRWEASFYRPAQGNEIGPVLETKSISDKFQSGAILFAREIAKQYGWRYLTVAEAKDADQN